MKRLILTALMALLTIVAPVIAQQAGTNVNVLPVVLPLDLNHDGRPDDPDWYLKGDGYLQRQLEPTIAVSTRNPDHLVAFFNDYRAVDIGDDTGLGEGDMEALTLKAARLYLTMVPWLDLPKVNLPSFEREIEAASEAWVGMSRSYDGGLTWSGAFLPGGQFDGSPASLASPVHGLEAASDPVTVSGPCGRFYTVFVAFDRGGQSKLAVARYEDLNNDPGGDTIVYKGTTVIETGNNATYGHFLDKPSINIDVFRDGASKKKPVAPPGGTDQCASRLYVSYSTFTGKPKPGKFQSKVTFAVSEDGGLTFSTQKINKNFGQNQGTVIAVDPRQGTPTTTGGGTVYTFWRHFNSPDSIIMTKSINYGSSWSKPQEIIGSQAFQKFDQPTISTDAAIEYGFFPDSGLPEVAFRSNAFPTATVAVAPDSGGNDASVFVAWQERVGSDGYPLTGGTPRIVMMRSDNDGGTWTDTEGIPGQRRAVDYLARDQPGDPTVPEPGYGVLPQPRFSGPQVMPMLSFGGGRLMLAYSEARGRIADYGTAAEHIEPDANVSPLTGFISGYDQVMDFRATLLSPSTGQRLSSIQVSRYPLSAGADLTEETLEDVAPINPPCSPDHDGLGLGPLNPCVRQVNRVNAPHSAGGTSPFIGDYLGLHPFVQFVTDADGHWRWATEPGDLQTRGFHAVWADNRHLVPPQNPSPGSPWIEWMDYSNYDPPGTGQGSCANPGSRNTDVLTARVDAELVISSPTSYKAIGATGASFPFTISNQTATERSYRLTVTPDNGIASFLSKSTETEVVVDLFPFSSTAQVVYVFAPTLDPIVVNVQELSCTECQTGTITFNADETMASDQRAPVEEFFNPTIEPNAFVINYKPATAFVINPTEQNAFVINPSIDNAFVINPGTENAFVINAFVINAFVINAFEKKGLPGGKSSEKSAPEYYNIYDVIDTTWTVSPGESTDATSFLPLLNVDNASRFTDNYVFQLIVHKGSLYGTLNGCEPANVNQPQVLSTFAQGPKDLETQNAFVINPSPQNAFVINRSGQPAFPQNAFVINSTFTVAPSDDVSNAAKSGSTNDGTLKAPRAPDEVFVTLRAYRIKPTEEMEADGDDFYNPYPAGDPNNPTGKAGDRASFATASLDCDTLDPDSECVEFNAPDLVPIDVDPTPIKAEVGLTFDFPAWTVRNQGTTDGNAENADLRHGFYLCPRSVVADATDDQQLDVSSCTEFAEFASTMDNTLPPDGEDPISATTIIVPAETMPGLYDVVVYVDNLFQVSEFNEVNNYAAVPITVIGELLKNGGFETPAITNTTGWQLYPKGTAGLDWTFEWVGCDCAIDPLLELQRNGLVVPGADGGQYAELDSDFGGTAPGQKTNLRLYKDFDTCEGVTYDLAYSWAQRTTSDRMQVSWGDTPVATHEGAAINTWFPETASLTGDGTTKRLEFVELGPANSLGMFLDSVSLVGPLCPKSVQ